MPHPAVPHADQRSHRRVWQSGVVRGRWRIVAAILCVAVVPACSGPVPSDGAKPSIWSATFCGEWLTLGPLVVSVGGGVSPALSQGVPPVPVYDAAALARVKAQLLNQIDQVVTTATKDGSAIVRLGPPRVPDGAAIARSFDHSFVSVQQWSERLSSLVAALPTTDRDQFVRQRSVLDGEIGQLTTIGDTDFRHAYATDDASGGALQKTFAKTPECRSAFNSGD